MTIIIVGGISYGSMNYAQSKCSSNGGVLVEKQDSAGKVCVKSYIDGGTPCKSSIDCEGRCYIHEGDIEPKCEYDDSPYKCVGTITEPPHQCSN